MSSTRDNGRPDNEEPEEAPLGTADSQGRAVRSPDPVDVVIGWAIEEQLKLAAAKDRIAKREVVRSRATLAEHLGVSLPTISMWCSGERRVLGSWLLKIAQYLGCPMSAFFPMLDPVSPLDQQVLELLASVPEDRHAFVLKKLRSIVKEAKKAGG